MQAEKAETFVVVVGAANLDIIGFSDGKIIPGDSNPGRIRLCIGGVGRNIAENLARIGVETQLITATGDDLDGSWIREHCIRAGIRMNHSLTVPGVRSSTYMAIMDNKGDMNTALSDLSIIDYIDDDYLRSKHKVLSDAAVIVADTNLSPGALGYLADGFPDSVLCIDAVSSTKAKKLIPLIGKIHTLKMNQIEAGIISGLRTDTDDDIRKCGSKLFEAGVRRIFITMGSRGVYWKNRTDEGIRPPEAVDVVNTTGAGDAFMAGIVLATLHDFETEQTLNTASAIAALTISGEETVNPKLNKEKLREMLNVEWN